MRAKAGWALGVLLFMTVGGARAETFRPFTWKSIDRFNKKLHGQVLDFTHNHRDDNRIWSPSLCAKRDVYVYLPPCFDPARQYPAMLYLHGIGQDEVGFLRLVELVDNAVSCGRLPPIIIAAPDGTTVGRPSIFNAGSFYVNSRAGNFEDYIICDIWNFMTSTFPIRPERDQHVLAGASMGGFGAYNLGIKYRDKFGIVAGIFPPLHTRYLDCRGRYFADYNPCCLGLRPRVGPFKPVGRFAGGLITVREHSISGPLYGIFNPDAINEIARENPFEMLDNFCVKPGDLQMFVGYGTRDQFNLDAQAEAFVDKARCKGLDISCVAIPNGKHDTDTGVRIFPHLCDWLAPRLACPGK